MCENVCGCLGGGGGGGRKQQEVDQQQVWHVSSLSCVLFGRGGGRCLGRGFGLYDTSRCR